MKFVSQGLFFEEVRGVWGKSVVSGTHSLVPCAHSVAAASRAVASMAHAAAEKARCKVAAGYSVGAGISCLAVEGCSVASGTGFLVPQGHAAAANSDSVSADVRIWDMCHGARSAETIFLRQSSGCEKRSGQ